MNDYNGPSSYSYSGFMQWYTQALLLGSGVGILVCAWLIVEGEPSDRILGITFLIVSIGALMVTGLKYRYIYNVYTPSEHGFNWHNKTDKGHVPWSDIGLITTGPMDFSINFHDRTGIKRFSLDRNLTGIEWLLKRVLDCAPEDAVGTRPKNRFMTSIFTPIALMIMAGALISGTVLGVVNQPGEIAGPTFLFVVMIGIWASYFKIVNVESQGLRVWAPFMSTVISYSVIRRVDIRVVVSRTQELGLVIEWDDAKAITIRLPLIDVMRLYVQIREGRHVKG